MRISDWSADVCSSDLRRHGRCVRRSGDRAGDDKFLRHILLLKTPVRLVGHVARRIIDRTVACSAKLKVSDCVAVELDAGDGGHWIDQSDGRHTDRLGIFDQRLHSISRLIALHDYMRLEQRSEEHTSELQSLMRISYAVFCLKKK